MRILLLFNPISGRGRAAAIAERASAALAARGHEVTIVATCADEPARWLVPALGQCDLVVIAGGDGAVRMVAPAAAEADRPIYHLPCGTENLFAREWGMDARVETLLAAIDGRRTVRIDIARADGEPFLLMASVGMDAEVVNDIAATRCGAITHMTYVRPILRQWLGWRAQPLEIEIDGEIVTRDVPGCAVVANCRQYGWRIDPAARARMDDGLLDVVFFPVRSRLELLRWALASRAGRHLEHPRLLYRRGRGIVLRAAREFRYQLDGDVPAGPRCPVQRLRVEVEPAALEVLLPPAAASASRSMTGALQVGPIIHR